MPGDPIPRDRGQAGESRAQIHASCVAYEGQALLITGPSGAGKSALALDLISRGARLVSDDQTVLTREAGGLVAQAPETIAGRIEARGVGLLRAPVAGPSPVTALVDLSQDEPERLPPHRHRDILGLSLPLLLRSDSTCFPAALILYLTHGRYA